MRPKENLSTYYSWESMKRRCLNPNNHGYENYGGRGIEIEPDWIDFEGFLKDMGPRPEGTTLERIDVNWHYEAGNCRWATYKEQAHNRRDNKLNQEDVDHIRHAPKIVSHVMLADLYGVGPQHISRVRNNQQWA